VDIHPFTSHDIARMRGEERLLRAQAALRAQEVSQQQLADRGARRIDVAPIRLLQRIRRRTVVRELSQGPDAV